MKKLPEFFIILLILGSFLAFPSLVPAAVITSQTQKYDNIKDAGQIIQELGSNLSGTAANFTFRVVSTKPNLDQFDNTASSSRIYNKTTNTYISGCVSKTDSAHPFLKGLTFTTSGVPLGYQDVTIDFSCNNYTFIPGNKYLIKISNANLPTSYAGLILFASASYGSTGDDFFTEGGLRFGNGNKFDTSNNSGSCDPITYKWNDLTKNPKSGCNIWTSPKDDLYFILKNTAPEPAPTPSPTPTPSPVKTAVIFIPGIGGSELKAEQNIVWSADDGHGGTFSHAYLAGEKIWVNQDEATKLGDDDYFDVLRLKDDGITSEASLSLTGSLTSSGYEDIEPFFTGLGYSKNIDFFIFPYDWRKDIRTTKDSLDNLIETAKTTSGKSKVNIVAHSMGGLIARYYIAVPEKAAKVDKLIELGVPHLGSVDSLKSLIFGIALKSKIFGILPLGIPSSEMKDVGRNLTSIFQLLPSNKYYDFYNNADSNMPYPFDDARDIDSDKATGALNFSQTKTLLANLGHNMTVFNLAEQFHKDADKLLNQDNNVATYIIAGSSQPTLGQIRETWWINWPVNLIPKTEEIFVNGDDTVPLYSASLKNSSLDLSGGAGIYYVEQTHGGLISKNGPAMQTVKTILNQESLPTEVKSEKINLEGQHLSLDDGELELYDENGNHTGLKDNGEIETSITDTFYSTSGKSKHAFIKKKAKKVKVKLSRKTKTFTSPTKPSFKILSYKQDKINKTILYKSLPVKETTVINFDLDPTDENSPSLSIDNTTILPTSEISGTPALDLTPPETKIEISGSTVTLTASDEDSGILKIEYSLDNGQSVQTYTAPFTVSTSNKTTLQVKAIDKAGNEEIPQEKIVESASSTTSSSSSSSNSSISSTSSNTNSSSDSTNGASSITLNVSKESQDSNVEIANSASDQTHNGNTSVLGINTGDKPQIINHKSSIFNHPVLGGLLTVFISLQTMLPVVSSTLLFFFKPAPK